MIRLGKIAIKNKVSIIRSRQKVYDLALSLNFNTFIATQITSLFSEIITTGIKKEDEISVECGLERKREGYHFNLKFLLLEEYDLSEFKGLESVFDSAIFLNGKDASPDLILTKELSDMAFKPNKKFISNTVMQIESLSEEELFEELKATNTELNQTLGKLKETQGKLVQSEKMGSLGQLTAGVAHELNNPINFVNAGTSALQDDIADIFSLLRKYEELIKEKKIITKINTFKEEIDYDFLMENIPQTLVDMKMGSKRTADIVKGLRNFSRLETDEKILSDIHEGIDSTLILLKNKLKNKVEVVKNYDQSINQILCYPGHLNQVFMNLFVNAEESIVDRGVITITTSRVDDQLIIKIQDTGCGMDKETTQKMFDPFFTTKEVGKGTGLGLSITYGIIQEHEGEITVQSTIGKGTELTITLPCNTV